MIPNPSDRHNSDTGQSDSAIEAIVDPKPGGPRKIDYAGAITLFKELLRKDNEEKKTSRRMHPVAGRASDDSVIMRQSRAAAMGFDDDDDDDDEEVNDAG